MKEFVEASELTFDAARRLRADLELLSLVTTAEVAAEGARREFAISLTPLGRELAKHAVAMEEVLRRYEEREAPTKKGR